ncbi:MAG TPA: glucose-6-phosphate isomerase [bacterium]|nr:glucose-6-phosphate isomerase [bacterium]HQG45576.1 glucose-6-phosphate isomerase [bacterium]HQI47911.1 glucose-6-phosphate isomerase [bacterium]HQJ66325.1 glucose-6-phosphate isomerase [bacterium]
MVKLNIRLLAPEVDEAALKALQPAVRRVVNQLYSGRCPGSEMLGWRDLPLKDYTGELRQIQKLARKIRKKADLFIVVGIGGSYLGARAAIEGLSPALPGNRSGPEILFLGHHLDADYAAELLRYIKGKRYYVNVISKSGTTTEPGIAFRLLLDQLQRTLPPKKVRERVIATTSPVKGALHAMANKFEFHQFAIPEDIGGRFSVLTPVGLLPMAVAGIDIARMLKGAAAMARHCSENRTIAKNDALKYAAARHLLYQAGKPVEILGVWNPALLYLAEWWKQLFGESEGKDKKGTFPAAVGLTTDLHSLGQYIQDGRRDLLETFLVVDRNRSKVVIPRLEGDPDQLGFLAGKQLAYANRQAWRGTMLAHRAGGTPNMTLHLGKRDAFHFGELFYFFEFAVAVSGLLLGVNPFNQDGVEAYKNNMFALLGQPGHETEGRALEEQLKEIDDSE